MFYVRNFIVGGYAYYRKKGFGHSGSVSMILLSSLGFVFLILHGVLNANGFSFFSSFEWYALFSVFMVGVLWLYINSLLCKRLKIYEFNFESSIGSNKIRLHCYITYLLIVIFILVRVFI